MDPSLKHRESNLHLGVYCGIAGVLIAILVFHLGFVNPRTKRILCELRRNTIADIAQRSRYFGFTQFMAWHTTCHQLDRRESRVGMWLRILIWGPIAGALFCTLLGACLLLGFSVPCAISQATNGLISLCFICAVVALIEPSNLVFRHR